MGINLHLLAHRSYPYIDNLHIYVVKCRLKQKKSAFVRKASQNGGAKLHGEGTRTSKRANALANKTECEKRNKQTEILSGRHLHLNSSFPHACSFTLQCNECARYIIADADWISKSMMRIDFLLANIRFYAASKWRRKKMFELFQLDEFFFSPRPPFHLHFRIFFPG